MSDIQAVIFDKKYWPYVDTMYWLYDHQLEPIKPVHITKKFYRYRIRDPSEFNHIRTIKTDADMDLLIGFY